MKELTNRIKEQNKIIRELAPEIDNAPQQILYQMALQAVDNDTERFKQVLENAEDYLIIKEIGLEEVLRLMLL
jgi:hypothetical protein